MTSPPFGPCSTILSSAGNGAFFVYFPLLFFALFGARRFFSTFPLESVTLISIFLLNLTMIAQATVLARRVRLRTSLFSIHSARFCPSGTLSA